MGEIQRIGSEKEAQKKLIQWKEKYQAVFMTEVNEVTFVWRELTRAEYRKSMEFFDDDHERAEYVCKLCVLDPVGVDYDDDIYAGIPDTLAQNILQESGFTGDDTKIKFLTAEYEAEMNRFDNQVSCIIAETFPMIPIEEIDNWSMEKTLWYFSRAKWILKHLRGVRLEEKEDQSTRG